MTSAYIPYGGTPIQSCQRCGKPLPSNEISCNNCGYSNAFIQRNNPNEYGQPPSNTAGAIPQLSYDQAQSGGPQWGLPPQSITPSAQNYSYPQIPFPSQQGATAYPGWSTQTMGNGGNLYGTVNPANPSAISVPQQPFSAVSFVPVTASDSQLSVINDLQAPNTGTSQSSRLRPKGGFIIGIVLLLVVLVGGAVASSLFINASNARKSTSPKSTSPVISFSPKVPPIFADSFHNNAKGWDLQSDTGKPSKFSVAIDNSALTLEDDNNKLLWEMVPGGKTFSDFKLTVNATLAGGEQSNGYGIYIRGASNANTDLATYYRFELYGDGTYAVFKGIMDSSNNSTNTKLVDYTMSSAIQKQGGINHILIVAHGPSMTLIVNGQTLKTISDPGYTSGSVALFVSNLPSVRPGAQAKFSSFAIYPLQA